jgi:hypothetical protein
MTDPLRPFTQTIRSLWRFRTRGARDVTSSPGTSAASAMAASTDARPPASRAGETLQSRLKSRLAAIDRHDVKQMREAFVETVLRWEIGDQLAMNAGLAEVVARVSEQLTTDPAVVERLQELLLEISAR